MGELNGRMGNILKKKKGEEERMTHPLDQNAIFNSAEEFDAMIRGLFSSTNIYNLIKENFLILSFEPEKVIFKKGESIDDAYLKKEDLEFITKILPKSD